MGSEGKDVNDRPVETDSQELSDQRRRQQALRDMAERQGASAPENASSFGQMGETATTVSKRTHRPHWFARGGVALVALVIAAGALVYWQSAGGPSHDRRATATPTIPNQLTLDLAAHHLSCPIRAEWAPDARRIAVALVGQSCEKNPGLAGAEQIAIFDARTGALERTIDPHILVDTSATAVTYPNFAWSPDGKQLLFDASATASDGQITPGLLIYPLEGGAPRSVQAAPISATSLAGPSVVWDTHAWTAREQSGALPVAFAYQWTASGQINATQPPAAIAAAGYAGSPVETPSGQTFSLWQSGYITPLDAFDTTGAGTPFLPPPGYAFTASAARWSPDGAYLAMPLWLSARLAPVPGLPTSRLLPASCADRGLPEVCAGSPTSLPDAALAAVVKAEATPESVRTSTGSISQYSQDSTAISWRPDGKTLAAVLPATVSSTDPSSGASTINIALYNTGSGQEVAKLQLATVAFTGGSSPRFGTAPAWSPSGQQLAYVDSQYGQVVIWGASQLPA